MTVESIKDRYIRFTQPLTQQELAQFIDHLEEGRLETIRNEEWYHHVETILPQGDNPLEIYWLLIVLIEICEDRWAGRKKSAK